MRRYADFDLELSDYLGDAPERFGVHVRDSPKGRQFADNAQQVELPPTLRAELRKLERRELDEAGIIALGAALGELLLPTGEVRALFKRNLEALGGDQGLRVRIITHDPELAQIPWEYLHIAPSEMPARLKDSGGFLVLDPLVSIVRYEALEAPIKHWKPIDGKVDLVAVLASSKGPGRRPLDLDREKSVLAEALDDIGGVTPRILRPGTWSQLTEALKHGCDIFHFAGHGEFAKAMGEVRHTSIGAGKLVFSHPNEDGDPHSAGELGKRLRATDTRLAVLSACEAARTDSESPWSGVAPSLVRSGIPAVVGMQHTIRDDNAIAFAKGLYKGLADGRNIDTAVHDGRTAIHGSAGPPDRDFGAPVVFMRGPVGVIFPPSQGRLRLNVILLALVPLVFALWGSLHFRPYLSEIQGLIAGFGIVVWLAGLLGPFVLSAVRQTVWAPKDSVLRNTLTRRWATWPIALLLVAGLALVATTRSVWIVQHPEHADSVEIGVERQVDGASVNADVLTTDSTDRISGFVWALTNPRASVKFDVRKPVAMNVKAASANKYPSVVIDVPGDLEMKRTKVIRLVLGSVFDGVLSSPNSSTPLYPCDLRMTIDGTTTTTKDIRLGVVIFGATEPELRSWVSLENDKKREDAFEQCLIPGSSTPAEDLLIRWRDQIRYVETPIPGDAKKIDFELVMWLGDKEISKAKLPIKDATTEVAAGGIHTECLVRGST
jgi:CHAT domain